MKKLIVKSGLFAIISFLFIASKIVYENPGVLKDYHLSHIPLNNVSDSHCFRARLDHLVGSDNFKNCTFLVAGSSMSLNNISGSVIHSRLKECVYNISSWNFKPQQLKDVLKITKSKGLKFILLGFNNCDFGKPNWSIDLGAMDLYINGNGFQRSCSFIKKFNMKTFSDDWDLKLRSSKVNNLYESTNFDKYGSILLERNNFVINKDRWNFGDEDTSGFYDFYKSVIDLDSFCRQNKISLFLAYLPSRPNLLSSQAKILNKKVSAALEQKFGDSFVDLQGAPIPLNQFCDGDHLFKEGAESITNLMIDSFNLPKPIFSTSKKSAAVL